jgi:hypothetical protein
VYLAYLDDSDTRNKEMEWQVVSAILIPADSFFVAEFVSAITIEDLMDAERREKFEEFHACELYGGYGVFEGIDQSRRFAAIANLLNSLHTCAAKVGYGAVNLVTLRKSPFGSAHPQDVAFRRCVLGVGNWLTERVFEELGGERSGNEYTALFIMDEAAHGDKTTQVTLQRSFRSLRAKFRIEGLSATQLPFVHDDMYFGDSKYSVGIQIADLCSYFIAKHLAGDVESEGFYKMVEPHIISTGKEE